jgi:hypothetical protein
LQSPSAPADRAPEGSAVRTKSCRQDDIIVHGDSASKVAGRDFVGKLLVTLKAKASPVRLIFDLTLPQYEHMWREAAYNAGIDNLKTTPHSARHAGASIDAALNLHTKSEIQKWGQWDNPLSVKRYQRHGRLLRQLAKMSPGQLVLAKNSRDDMIKRLSAVQVGEISELRSSLPDSHPPAHLAGYGSNMSLLFVDLF